MLEDESTLGQCGEEGVSTLEVAGAWLEVKSMFPGPCWERKRKNSQGGETGEEEENRQSQVADAVQLVLDQCCAHFCKKTPMPTLKSAVILAFPDKVT